MTSFIVFLLLVGVVQLSDRLQAEEQINYKEGSEKFTNLNVSLGEAFVLHENQSAKIRDEDFEIKIIQFYNSPCPNCVWYGVGIACEYYHGGEVRRGINLVQAFGYQIIEIESDNETYAKLRIIKIETENH